MNGEKDLTSELVLETAQIRWHELQRFFASGNAIAVDASLDLIQVATGITNDNAAQVKAWMDAGLVDTVKDVQATEWYEQDALVWALVIKPWVLVQPIESTTYKSTTDNSAIKKSITIKVSQ